MTNGTNPTPSPEQGYKIPLSVLYKLYNRVKNGRIVVNREFSRRIRNFVEKQLEAKRKKLAKVLEGLPRPALLEKLLGKALRVSSWARFSFLTDREGSWSQELTLDVAVERERFLEPFLRERYSRARAKLLEYIKSIREIAEEAAFRRYISYILHSDEYEAHRPMREVILKDPRVERVFLHNLHMYLFDTEWWPRVSAFLGGEFDSWTGALGLLQAALQRTSRGSKIRALLLELIEDFYRVRLDDFTIALLANRAESLGFSVVQQSGKLLRISVEPRSAGPLLQRYLHTLLWVVGVRSIKIYLKRPFRYEPNGRGGLLKRLSSWYDRRYSGREIETYRDVRLREGLNVPIREKFYIHNLHLRLEVVVRKDAPAKLKLIRLLLLLLVAILLTQQFSLTRARAIRALLSLIPFVVPLMRVLIGLPYDRLEHLAAMVASGVEWEPGRLVQSLGPPPPIYSYIIFPDPSPSAKELYNRAI